MNIFGVTTLVLLILKLTNLVQMSWFTVFLPILVLILFVILLFFIWCFLHKL